MPSRRSTQVSLVQLAAHTGLSVAAVSSVLNGLGKERRISEQSVKRVQEAARELGYVPNIFARRLSMHSPGTSQAIFAVVTAREAPLGLVSQAAMALHRAVETGGKKNIRYTITIEMFAGGQLSLLPGLLDNHRFSGVIVANTLAADDKFLASAQIPYPVVAINRDLTNCASVRESPDTGRTAAELLLKAGCRHCAVITPAPGTSATAARANDFAAAIGRLAPHQTNIVTAVGRTEEDGYSAMRSHLRKHSDTDGLFATSDALAIGAYHAIIASGRKIPEDIRVVGVGDHAASPHLSPPLTCVGSSEEELHQNAAELLLALFSGRETGKPHRVLPLQIIRRESTG